MYQKKEYNTLRLVANFTSGFGWIIVGILALIGLIVGWKSAGFLVGVFGGAVFGIVVGVPFIVAGQMVSVFLDQKDLLEEISDSLKKKEGK
ncbi:MAG: hypothetical protein HZC10_05670 [Nitrospirae bacterium]|nr:hypothetical protein [Nitrospirota bacterium]